MNHHEKLLKGTKRVYPSWDHKFPSSLFVAILNKYLFWHHCHHHHRHTTKKHCSMSFSQPPAPERRKKRRMSCNIFVWKLCIQTYKTAMALCSEVTQHNRNKAWRDDETGKVLLFLDDEKRAEKGKNHSSLNMDNLIISDIPQEICVYRQTKLTWKKTNFW